MAAQGRNSGFHVLDDFVSEALHAPLVPLAVATRQGRNEGMSVVEELIVDIGPSGDNSDESDTTAENDRHRHSDGIENEAVFAAALAAFRAGNQQDVPVLLRAAQDFLSSRRGFWIRDARRSGSLEEEDVIDDVVASLPKLIQGFAANDLGSFHRWLAVVARHRVIDLLRREVRQTHDPRGDLSDPGAAIPSESEETPQEFGRLLSALAELPGDDRILLTLRLSGMSLPEISELLGTSPITSARKFHRILDELLRQHTL